LRRSGGSIFLSKGIVHAIACNSNRFLTFLIVLIKNVVDRMHLSENCAIITVYRKKSMRSASSAPNRRLLTRLAIAVRKRRKELSLKQSDLAKLAGCDRLFVSQVEGGKRTVRLDKLLDLLQVLGYQLTLETGKERLDEEVREALD
jgi:HTH-type transcriptional regulator / antitoxin HipB